MPDALDRPMTIPTTAAGLSGTLHLPDKAVGVVLFAHGSGSSRHSPRNRYVAEQLHAVGVGTLLFDLLSEGEGEDRRLVFDIPLLARRLLSARDELKRDPELALLPVGYFGASTGAAAALVAAAEAPEGIRAVVSRGGRPDLAGEALARVRAPTLLIVGGHDPEVLALNREALAQLDCPKSLVVVPGATHLFEEPGTLGAVAQMAGEWFRRQFESPLAPCPPLPGGRGGT